MGESNPLILDINRNIEVDENLVIILKPHQRDGVSFMWNALFKDDHGCILAHCMGLGKYRNLFVKYRHLYGFFTHSKKIIAISSTMNFW